MRRVTADPERPVFLALHDQRNLAGFGNEYVNELCFLHGLLPTRPVGEVPDVGHVIGRGQRLISANRDRLIRVFTGNARPGEEHWVFARDRRPCRRCGATVQRGELGDDPVKHRNTFWCPQLPEVAQPARATSRSLSPDHGLVEVAAAAVPGVEEPVLPDRPR